MKRPHQCASLSATGSHVLVLCILRTMEWSNEKVIAFLEILQTEPCLWDPRVKSYKNRAMHTDAWRRIKELLPFETTIEEMKKKKESLMGYYRTHLNRIKKSLKSGAGKDDVYTTNWFAFEMMDNFLRGVYDGGRTLNTETHDDNEAKERSEGRNDGNENSPHLSAEIEEASQSIQEENRTLPRENKSSQNYGKKKQLRDELPEEIKAARRQMDEAFEFMKEKKDDEYEMFGRLLYSKLKKIRNPNTRDTRILMNDIHNLVFRACMADRREQQSAVPQLSTSLSPRHQAFSPSSNSPTYHSPPDPSASLSPHHQAFSPSSNSSKYHLPPDPDLSNSLSPHHQAFSSSPNPPTYQSPPPHDTNSPPPDQFSVQTPQENFLELSQSTHGSKIVITDSGEIKIIKD